jgi:uncharacterized protein YbjQ (UPF0145 family)
MEPSSAPPPPPAAPSQIFITNVERVPGYEIEQLLGLVQGSTIRAKHAGRDFMAGLKNIVGGELKGYTELLQESRRESTHRMLEQARELGANAVINVRYTTSSVAQGASEILAYGTAVRLRSTAAPASSE